MGLLELIILLLLGYLCLYTLVDRICKCVEKASANRSSGAILELLAGIQKMKQEENDESR